jgi:hypothetical protein
MRSLALVLVAAATLAVATAACAQSTARVRGTITGVDAAVMAVKTREGRDVKLVLGDNVTVAVAKAARFEDLKPGDFVGVTTTPGPDGMPLVVEVHYLAPTTTEGQSSSDLMPNATMTNASVTGANVVNGKREVTLQFKGTTQKAVVPDGAAIVRGVPGTRADLVPGEYVFVVAQVGADGTMTAPRVQVSKDGVRPPQ